MKNLTELLLKYQLEIANDPSPMKVVLKGRQIGFSFILAYKCIQKAACCPGSLSVLLSINQRASEELLKKVKQWATCLQIFTDNRITSESNATEVKLSNGSRICCIPGGNPDAGRGLTVTGVLGIDEFAYVPHIEEVWQSVVPTMTNRFTGSKPEILIGSTPASKKSLFGRIWHNDESFKKFKVDIHRAIADGLPVNLEEIHKLVPDPEQFSIEYECKWSESLGGFIDPSIVDTYEFDGKVKNGYYCGIDFGYRNDATAVAIIRADDSFRQLENIVLMKNVDFPDQFRRIRDLHDRYHFIAGYTDENGIGAAIAQQIQREVCHKISGYATTGANKTPNYEYLRNMIFNHKFLVNKDFIELVREDFSNVQKSVNDAGKITYFANRAFGMHSDVTSAIVLGLQAARDNPMNAASPVTFQRPSAFSGSTFGSIRSGRSMFM